MVNDFKPWEAYHTLKVGQLVALDKCPDVHPIGISESWNASPPSVCSLLLAAKQNRFTAWTNFVQAERSASKVESM
jgi:hypothetical protein